MNEKKTLTIRKILRIIFAVLMFLILVLPMYNITNYMSIINPSSSGIAELKPINSLINLEKYGGSPWIHVNHIYVIILGIIMYLGMILAILSIKDNFNKKMKGFTWIISSILILIPSLLYMFTPFDADLTGTMEIVTNYNGTIMINAGAILAWIMIILIITEQFILVKKRT
ncbi:MAG: hypothetical protein JXA99_04870 [Candidatus Lokiarchaeota archaeon]|nr:hypothetical protein [Candidatus Lokiarchaeota archaeon]